MYEANRAPSGLLTERQLRDAFGVSMRTPEPTAYLRLGQYLHPLYSAATVRELLQAARLL